MLATQSPGNNDAVSLRTRARSFSPRISLTIRMHRVVPDFEMLAAAALLTATLVVGISSASDYGISIDEFNADDYGPKALAWYTSGFTDRAHFEQVEAPLWYYGPWFQIVVAYLQSFEFADRFTVRHAATFVLGLTGISAALPLGRLAFGRWTGVSPSSCA